MGLIYLSKVEYAELLQSADMCNRILEKMDLPDGTCDYCDAPNQDNDQSHALVCFVPDLRKLVRSINQKVECRNCGKPAPTNEKDTWSDLCPGCAASLQRIKNRKG